MHNKPIKIATDKFTIDGVKNFMLESKLDDQIMIVTLTNGKTNSITRETLEQLKDCVDKTNQDKEIKGIILTGQNRFFSSGFDLYTFMGFNNRDEAIEFLGFADKVFLDLFICSKPVICAMNGHAAAGGLILAMASDYRLITDHPKIKVGMSEIKIGVPLSVAQSAIMRFGLDSDKKFRDLMYFGDMMDVTTAHQKGIVDELLAPENLINRAKELVKMWIDTPARPFCRLKEELKMETARMIRRRMADTDWQKALDCFFDKQVKDTLAFVQSTME
ncbi:FadJ [Desulfamplus magnetovallimortis]|uniref:FadJ n=1 Tax=Desulfamplus magnetovallimortis TaxID=1246637 RepID=A0A1W1H654_9BACT|nr:enoyl-CoA hydratase/isomerase family protein [Desulfamplus magnetovallimortis]SLM27970.1 FadJ [Desulfamplus magnetovallimortis]